MPAESSFDIIILILTKLRVFLGRPEVQEQLLTIAACLAFAGYFTRFLKRRTMAPINHWIDRRRPLSVQRMMRWGYHIIQMISFPLFGLAALGLSVRLLKTQGAFTGLLSQFSWLLVTLLLFQLTLAIVYLVFDEHEVKRYHYRFLLPLLVVVIILEVLSKLVSLQDLASLEVLSLFERPITLGAIFIATIGLYFWTDGVHGVQELTHKFIKRRTNIDPGSAQATLTLIRYALVILGIFYAISQLRLDSTSVAAITGGLSVGIGFGLREILSNFVSGLLLLFERSLHPGDVLEIDGELCVVERFSIRATTVRTLNHIELVIPNQIFFTAPFKTYTGTDRTVRVPLIVKTDCAIDARRVQAVIQHAVIAHEDVMSDPAPSVFILEYGDNVATFQVNIWLENPLLSPKTVSEVRIMIWDAFDAYDIALPTPEYEVHFSNRRPLEMAPPKPIESASHREHTYPQTLAAEGSAQ